MWLAAVTGAVAGVVHVFSGPDHLAAVLPFAVASPRRALRVGVTWGLGHGLGVLVLGAVFMFVRDVVDVDAISHGAELFVGVLLVALGAWAIRRSRLLVIHTHDHDHAHEADDHVHPHVHLKDDSVGRPDHAERGEHEHHHHSSFGFGFVHGVAGVGHLVVASPLLALSGASAVAYLSAYLLGGIAAMSGFALVAGRLVRRPAWVPTSLVAAGAVSIIVGVFWIGGFAAA